MKKRDYSLSIMFIFLFLAVLAVALIYNTEESPILNVQNSDLEEGISCSDGTKDKECAYNRPYFCDKGNLIENCKTCGCENGFFCNNLTCSDCKENWICSEWLECTGGKEKRSCFDINNCETNLKKPVIEQNC